MKILNINHADLDAVLCTLVLQKVYGKENVETIYCGYHNVNTVTEYMIENHDKWDLVYITDISISKEMADRINMEVNTDEFHKVVLIDHHMNKATEHLLAYDWVHMKENDYDDRKTSACKLVYDYFCDRDAYTQWSLYNFVLYDLIILGRDYDTWRWNEDNNARPRDLNRLCGKLGFGRLLEECHRQIDSWAGNEELPKEFVFTDKLSLLLELYNEELDRYVTSCEKNMFIKDFEGLTLGVYYGELYASEVGNLLCERNPHLDATIGINMRTGASIRTIKNDLHVGDLAQRIGELSNMSGQGHKKSAGVTLTKEFKEETINMLLGGLHG